MTAATLLDATPIMRLVRGELDPVPTRAAPTPSAAATIEQCLLGALICDAAALVRCGDLRIEYFERVENRQLFQVLLDCREESGAADLPILLDRLKRNGADDALIAYTVAVAESAPGGTNVEHYAKLVREAAQGRELAAVGSELLARANSSAADLAQIRRDALVRLGALRCQQDRPACIDWRALSTREPPLRRWAIRGWIGFGHVSLLAGVGGIGKTLMAQQIASALALGRRVIDEVQGPISSLLWACEDDRDELWRREVAIARWLDAPLDAFADGLHIQARHGLENTLASAEYGRLLFSPLLAELREQAEDLRAEVVILDNVAQLYGANENDRHQVTAFCNALSGALPGRAVLLLAHPARSAGSEFSGSSAWEAVARTRLYMGDHLPDQKPDQTEEPQADVRFLARRKANYSDRDWRRFTYRDGVLVPDVVEAQGGILAHLREQAAERAVMAGLKRLQGMGLNATDGSTSPRFLPKLLIEYRLADGRSKRELADAMRRLLLAGSLRRAKVGTGSDRHPIYGLGAT